MLNKIKKGQTIFFSVMILLALGCTKKNQKGNQGDSIAQKFDDYFQTIARNQEFSGSVLIAKNNQILVNRGYGFADRELKTPNGPQTKFRIGSITKCFTAILIMQLAEEGKLRLGGKINDHLTDYRQDTGSKITIYHLLTHTSGLPPGFSLPELSPDHYHDVSAMGKYVVQHCKEDLDSVPGEQWAYSNQGYYILGAIIRNRSFLFRSVKNSPSGR